MTAPPSPAEPLTTDFDRVRAVILRHGWNTTCYQILNEGMRHWISHDGEAAVGYVEAGGHILAAGAPVCSPEALERTVAEFEADHPGKAVCYVGAESRLNQIASASRRFDVVSLGAQPVWHPQAWLDGLKSHRSLREQLRRARAKGVRVSEWTEREAREVPELRRCLQAWLARKPIPNMRFLVEPDVFRYWGDRRLFVAEREGKMCGFVVLCPIPSRKGWLTEDFVRHPDAPNGTVELILHEAIRAIAADGAELLTMGMCPLSRRAGMEIGDSAHAWLRLVSKAGRSYGRVFYNFSGLEEFKAKFRPDAWEAVTVVRSGGRFSGTDLVAVVQAFTGYHPFLIPLRFARRKIAAGVSRLSRGAAVLP